MIQTPVWIAIGVMAILAIFAINAAGMKVRWAAMIVLCVVVMALAFTSLVFALESQDRHQASVTDDLAQENR